MELNRKPSVADKYLSLTRNILPAAYNTTHTGSEMQTDGLTDDEVERVNAWRALRQSSWAGAFYLCTTDILGPFNAPYAFRQNGYVPGVLLYVFMGAAAFYCGGLICGCTSNWTAIGFPCGVTAISRSEWPGSHWVFL
jgi:hypothetical protein